jgi:hypothetical protein
MSYNVSTVLHSVIYCLLLFALHQTHGTRRLYTSSRCMWQILHCNCSDYIKHDLTPVCNQINTRAEIAHASGAPEFTPVFSGVRVTRSLVLYVCFVDHCLLILFWSSCCLFFFDIRILMNPLVSSTSTSRWLFVLCLLAIVLSVLLPYTDSDYLWYLQTLPTRLLYSSLIGTCRIYYADRTNTWIYYLNVREGAIENWQCRETGNIEFTRQRQKQQKSKKQDTAQMSDTELKRIHLI